MWRSKALSQVHLRPPHKSSLMQPSLIQSPASRSRQDRCRILPELRRDAYEAYEAYEGELRRRGLWDDAGRSF
jgi:hypothetical protein